MRKNLLSGAYVLEGFACTSWFYHLEKASEHEESHLLPDVTRLLETKANKSYIGPDIPANDQLDSFRALAPEVNRQLSGIKRFLQQRWEDFCFDNGETLNSMFKRYLTVVRQGLGGHGPSLNLQVSNTYLESSRRLSLHLGEPRCQLHLR